MFSPPLPLAGQHMHTCMHAWLIASAIAIAARDHEQP